jgi:Zn finger protein HypA/HybF involved in hydrogenase expression
MSSDSVRSDNQPTVHCPFCGSADVDLISLFGQQLLTVQYYCSTCRTPFEKVKDDSVLTMARRREEEA